MEFAGRIERMLRLSLGVDLTAEVCKLQKSACLWTDGVPIQVDPFDEGDDSVEDEEEITDEEEEEEVHEPEEVPAESEAEVC